MNSLLTCSLVSLRTNKQQALVTILNNKYIAGSETIIIAVLISTAANFLYL